MLAANGFAPTVSRNQPHQPGGKMKSQPYWTRQVVASMGVQDNDPVVQKAIHRLQPFEQTAKVVNWIRDAGFKSINLDLIYGLPHQTVATFNQTLDTVLELDPDRLAVFGYAHVPWVKPAQTLYGELANNSENGVPGGEPLLLPTLPTTLSDS